MLALVTSRDVLVYEKVNNWNRRPLGLIGKLDKSQHGPAAVRGVSCKDVTGANALGRRRNMKNLSQKNCLFNNHR